MATYNRGNCPPGQHMMPDGSCMNDNDPSMRNQSRGNVGRGNKPIVNNRNRLVNNKTTLIKKSTGKGNIYVEAPNPRYNNTGNGGPTPRVGEAIGRILDKQKGPVGTAIGKELDKNISSRGKGMGINPYGGMTPRNGSIQTPINISYNIPIRNGNMGNPQTHVNKISQLVERSGYDHQARDIRNTLNDDMSRYITWAQTRLNTPGTVGGSPTNAVTLQDYVNDIGAIRSCGNCPGGVVGNCSASWCVSGGSWGGTGDEWNSQGNQFHPDQLKLNYTPKFVTITVSIYF